MKEEKKESKKIGKIVGIVLLILFVTLAILVGMRVSILTNIQKEYLNNKKSDNYYYHSISDGTVIECWRKEGTIRMNLKQVGGEGKLTLWKDTDKGESITLYENAKQYSEGEEIAMLDSFPTHFTAQENTAWLIAINPKVSIKTEQYEGKKCYKIKIGKQEEWIEKQTGLVLASKTEENVRQVNYSFGTVAEENVQKPELVQYTKIEQ